jgi:hypothetical protein
VGIVKRFVGTRAARRARGDDGAALVEFGLIALPLFLIVFGIIEFGWAFFQNLDVRHGAREGARLVAVNYKETASPTPEQQLDQIIAATCSRMDNGAGVSVRIRRPVSDADGGDAVGQVAQVHVEKDLDTLTGFLDFALGGIELKSDVEIRLEQQADWDNMGAGDLEPC